MMDASDGLGDAIADVLENAPLRERISNGARAAAVRLSLRQYVQSLTAVLKVSAADAAIQ